MLTREESSKNGVLRESGLFRMRREPPARPDGNSPRFVRDVVTDSSEGSHVSVGIASHRAFLYDVYIASSGRIRSSRSCNRSLEKLWN